MFRSLTRGQLLVDVAIGLALFVVRISFGVDSLLLGIAVGGLGVALALRRLSPLLALGVAWVGAVLQMVAGSLPDVANLAILAVLFATARYGAGAVRWFGLASAAAGAVVASVYLFVAVPGANYETPRDIIQFLLGTDTLISLVTLAVGLFAVLGLSWSFGLLVEMKVHAEQTRLERAKADEAIAIEQERNRIARDMHDVVAHSLAVVIAQADGARYARTTKPEVIDDALVTISTTAREALADVRILLGQLRHQQYAGPQPTITDLDQLVRQFRSSGMALRLEQSGKPPALAANQQLAVFRIVQEALTNALRHGSALGIVQGTIVWSAEGAEITITNEVETQQSRSDVLAPHRLGHGLIGMHERAEIVGGTFDAHRDGGSFTVRATIPVEGPA
ncbi:sensor histidine kinase [Rhodoglobus sp.]